MSLRLLLFFLFYRSVLRGNNKEHRSHGCWGWVSHRENQPLHGKKVQRSLFKTWCSYSCMNIPAAGINWASRPAVVSNSAVVVYLHFLIEVFSSSVFKINVAIDLWHKWAQRRIPSNMYTFGSTKLKHPHQVLIGRRPRWYFCRLICPIQWGKFQMMWGNYPL